MMRLFLKEGFWIKGGHAADENGKPISPTDNRAKYFSLYGSVIRTAAYHRVPSKLVHEVTLKAIKTLFPQHESVIGFNDDPATTYFDIEKVFHKILEIETGAKDFT